jgi:tetratricopeptide (TPR) repeat protein
MSSRQPFAELPPETVILVLDTEADQASRAEFAVQLAELLPRLNWQAHLYLVPGGRNSQTGRLEPAEIVLSVSRHLQRYQLTKISLHPLIQIGSQHRPEWLRLVTPARHFQTEAYQEQGESRLVLLPILTAGEETTADQTITTVRELREQLARPSLLSDARLAAALVDAPEAPEMRFYVAPAAAADKQHLTRQLRAHHVFESLVSDVNQDRDDLPRPCRPHLVVDQARAGVWTCLRAWDQGAPATASTGQMLPDTLRVDPALCADCIFESIGAMSESIVANHRRAEGRQVCFKLALAYSARDLHRPAVELAGRAAQLADQDQERAGALILKGLCHMSLGELPEADQSLQESLQHDADPGLVAFHRGRVEMAWRDEIEALERFQEALDRASPDVPLPELHLQMAMCHINLEEYDEARPHLDQALQPGREPPVWFYRGICDLNQDRLQPAMDSFQEALRLGPEPEDLGRVLLYIATCYKEQERFEEAIVQLQQAVAVDPDDLAIHNLLGYCYYKTGRHEQAVSCFLQAVTIDPRSAIDWDNLGSNLRDLGRTDEAISMYRKALSLDPTIGFARDGLNRLLSASGSEKTS